MFARRALLLLLLGFFTLSAQSVAAERKLVGKWFDKVGPWEQRIAIIQEDGKLARVSKFADGSTVRFELYEVKPQGTEKRRFVVIDAPFGEYCAIDNRGQLRLYDDEGFIRTAFKK